MQANWTADGKKWVDIHNEFKISDKEERNLWRKFWIGKLGYYPDKIAKVARTISMKQFNKEKEELNFEFAEFVKRNK